MAWEFESLCEHHIRPSRWALLNSFQMTILNEQPCDALLIRKSALYRKSRARFLEIGGTFHAKLLSSPRSLSSIGLIRNHIDYSPVAAELEWTMTDALQKKDKKHFETVRSFVTSVFHEQNHRILWRFLSEHRLACPQSKDAAHRYLNLIESLVVMIDWALGDELGPKLGHEVYFKGPIYNPGSDFMSKKKLKKRGYRNALHAGLHATYLHLEGIHPDDLLPSLISAFPEMSPKLLRKIADRTKLIDPLFVNLTNPVWQKKHVKNVMKTFRPKKGDGTIDLMKRTTQYQPQAYFIAETWFEHCGL